MPIVRATASNPTLFMNGCRHYFHRCRPILLLAKNLHSYTVQLLNRQTNSANNQQLLIPSDPDVLHAKLSGEKCGLPMIHDLNVSYTDENKTSPIVALAIHGCPGK